MIEKECSKCEKVKPISEFYRNKNFTDGYQYQCKTCSSKSHRIWRKNNPEKIKEYNKEYKKNNPEKVRENVKKWHKNNPKKVKEKFKRWREKNLERERKRSRKFYENNPEYWKFWRENNREKLREADRKRRRTPKGNLDHRMEVAIRESLKGKKNGRGWEKLVGYTIEDLKQHLEKQFKEGMNWNNYGKNGWEIDHIIPKSLFHFDTSEDKEFKRCWGLANIQPLWAFENIRKGKKII